MSGGPGLCIAVGAVAKRDTEMKTFLQVALVVALALLVTNAFVRFIAGALFWFVLAVIFFLCLTSMRSSATAADPPKWKNKP